MSSVTVVTATTALARLGALAATTAVPTVTALMIVGKKKEFNHIHDRGHEVSSAKTLGTGQRRNQARGNHAYWHCAQRIQTRQAHYNWKQMRVNHKPHAATASVASCKRKR
jgi:hypothetical protein